MRFPCSLMRKISTKQSSLFFLCRYAGYNRLAAASYFSCVVVRPNFLINSRTACCPVTWYWRWREALTEGVPVSLALSQESSPIPTITGFSNRDHEAYGEAFELVYGELKTLASAYMRRFRPNHTLSPAAIINEAYIHLSEGKEIRWHNKAHFIRRLSKISVRSARLNA